MFNQSFIKHVRSLNCYEIEDINVGLTKETLAVATQVLHEWMHEMLSSHFFFHFTVSLFIHVYSIYSSRKIVVTCYLLATKNIYGCCFILRSILKIGPNRPVESVRLRIGGMTGLV